MNNKYKLWLPIEWQDLGEDFANVTTKWIYDNLQPDVAKHIKCKDDGVYADFPDDEYPVLIIDKSKSINLYMFEEKVAGFLF